MLQLLWALLNITLFVFICLKGYKYFKQRSGSVAAVVFVIGITTIIGGNASHDNKDSHSNQVKTWTFNSWDSLDRNSKVFIDIDLERTLISKYRLGISYGQDRQLQNNIPVSAHTYTIGFDCGTSWKPAFITINRTDDNRKFEYEVDGTIKWSLLGITFYHQPRNWRGIALLK